MTCNEPKWLQVVPVPGSGGGGWGGGVWAGRGDGQCPVGLAAGGLGLSTAPLLLPWDSDQASPRPHGSQPRPGVAGRGLQGFLWIL